MIEADRDTQVEETMRLITEHNLDTASPLAMRSMAGQLMNMKMEQSYSEHHRRHNLKDEKISIRQTNGK